MTRFTLALFCAAALSGLAAAQTTSSNGGSPGPMADTCGLAPGAAATAPATGRGTRVYPAGQYPISLPAVSMLGARNDLPNPYRTGTHWGTLPDGRVWGFVVGIDLAPDGTIWAADRCGRFGTGGRPCLDLQVEPIMQFDASGKFLRGFGKGTIVTPHKLAVDR